MAERPGQEHGVETASLAERVERTEEALLESERRFRRSFESAAIGMALVSTEGRFLEVNDSLCAFLGYPRDELVRLTFQDLTHPEDLDLDLDCMRRTLAGELRSYQMEKRYVHRDGVVVWALLSVSLVTAADGSPVHFVSQVEDITARKQALEALERSETQLAEAQQIAHLGSWEIDHASGELALSRELCRIFEVGADETATLASLVERVHPDDVEVLRTAEARELAAGETSELEFRIVLTDGGTRWIYSRAEPVLTDGVVTGRRGISQDVTERKTAEQQLAAAERRYRTLVEQLPLGMYIRPLDMTRPNIYASPQVEPMLGWPAEEWERNPDLLAQIVHPDDRERVLAAARRVRTTGEPLRDEYRYITRDGRTIWVQDETYVVHDENGDGFVQGFLLDITERKQAEAERDRLRDELHHAQKLEALGRLAAGIAHDFNNMLTAIRGYADLLVARLEPGDAAHRDALQIKRAAEQAAALPSQLLAFGRKQSLQPKLVDLNEVVRATDQLLRHLVSETIDVDVEAHARQAVAFVDPSQFEHVLVNLALNARDAMPSGGTLTIATRETEVDAQLALEQGVTPGGYVVVSVADTGVGMDDETRTRIFEPYFTTKPHGQGSGLGLASVYGTVTQSGGFIAVATEPGKGTTFEIHVPLAEGAARPDGGTTVLLVEDEDVVRGLAVEVLESAGFEVHAAADGPAALELLERLDRRVDVVVTDVVMPGLGGRDLVREIRRGRPDLPVVFMSGYTDGGLDAEADLQGRAAFLQKPFSTAELVAAVREVATVPAESSEPPPLTPREREVIELVARGLTNERVAAALEISPETVQSHVRNVMRKLRADTRTEAVAKALRLSLIA